jgi:hypothetical protein
MGCLFVCKRVLCVREARQILTEHRLDEMHEEVVCGIAGLGVHVLCEKPLGTRLESCVKMYRALSVPVEDGCADGDVDGGGKKRKETIFGICHVLRYSPHNMMLRHLVVDQGVIGDVLSIEHVEPVGWWHFSHSYVRYVCSRRYTDMDADKTGAIGEKNRRPHLHYSQSPATTSTS